MYLLIGAGGHAKVIIDILEKNNNKIYGILDDSKTGEFLGYPVLGKVSEINGFINENNELKVIIAVGDNHIRYKIFSELEKYNVTYGQAVHPSAQIGRDVILEEGTVVMANCVVNAHGKVGKHVILNTSASVDHDCSIGDYAHISPGARLAGGVKVGFFSHVGIGASIIQNISIGNNSVIGAGAVVLNDIPDNVVAVGCPAKAIKEREN